MGCCLMKLGPNPFFVYKFLRACFLPVCSFNFSYFLGVADTKYTRR